MTQQLVTITSQGQITIPAAMRTALSLNDFHKASVRLQANKIIVEPIPDLLQLGGVLRHKAKKGKTITQIINQEEQALKNVITSKYSSKK